MQTITSCSLKRAIFKMWPEFSENEHHPQLVKNQQISMYCAAEMSTDVSMLTS